VNNREIDNLYFELLKIVVCKFKVPIREDQSNELLIEKYRFNGEERQIHIYRQVDGPGLFLDGRVPPDIDIRDFVERSSHNLHEVIGVAHEFGHSQSSDLTIDNLYKKARSGPITVEEKNRIFNEEIFAWSEARKVLILIGFEHWDDFCAQMISGLESYLAIQTT
jgi:hypothetical protein